MAQILLDLADDLKMWAQEQAERKELSLNAWLRLLLYEAKDRESRGSKASRKENG